MDGFFPPLNSRARGVKVPFVAKIQYDGPGPSFAWFPERKGYPLRNGGIDFDGKSTQDIASLLQSWLFFGLLSEFFGRRINPLLFVQSHESSGDTLVLEQDIVHDLFIDWKSHLIALPRGRRQARLEDIKKALQVALAKSELFDRVDSGPNDSTIATVALSVKLLIMLLQSIADDTFSNLRHPLVEFIYQTWFVQIFMARRRRSNAYRTIQEVTQQKLFLPLPPGSEKPSPAARILLERLVETGWCIHQATQACRNYDYLTVNYFSFLRRTIPAQINHEFCLLSDKCVAYNIDLSDHDSYQQRHVKDDCQCEIMSVPTEDVLSIIETGGIPLVSLTSKKGQTTLRIIRCRPWTRFAAVSHVWSDGMGNPTANALPTCQVERLREHLALRAPQPENSKGREDRGKAESSSKGSHHFFWMDTFCIPTGGKDDHYLEEMKSNAISRMAPVYAGATHVLVLDSELETATSSHTRSDGSHNDDEVSAHVLCSAWMMRSWCLQEAVLARSCYFQLANGSRSLQTSTWIDFFSKQQWSGLTRIFERSGESQEERLDLRSSEAQRLRHSPLVRHMARFSSRIPILVIRALQEDKKFLATISSAPERRKAIAALRVPQFIRAWNSLLDRSTTQPEDRHGIFANLLDFNAHHIRHAKDDQRLPKLIRSCDELPLSLLYNNGPRSKYDDSPKNDWIPLEVKGDKLAGEGIMRMAKDGWLIDATRCPQDSLLMFLVTKSEAQSPAFCLKDLHSGEDFIIEIQDQQARPYHSASSDSHDSHDSQTLSCLILDKSSGSSSLNGYTATGAFLTVVSITPISITLNFFAPLIAWTPQQYSFRQNPTGPHHSVILAENIRPKNHRLVLEYDPSPWDPPLPRRPLLSTHPTYPILIPYICTLTFIFLTASISLVLGITGIVQIVATIWIWSAELLIGVFVVFPAIHYFCMLTSYQAWVATFDEGWVPGGATWEGWKWWGHGGGIVSTWVRSWFEGWGDERRWRRRKRFGKRRARDVADGERDPLLPDAV